MALAGIQYPKTKEDMVDYASKQVSDRDLIGLIESLPRRIYRDSAEVAIALGELQQRQGVRSADEVARIEQPSIEGGRAAAASVSAITIAKVLSEVDFPKNRGELKDYAQKHITEIKVGNPERILDVIDSLPDKRYQNMADVEKSVGQVL